MIGISSNLSFCSKDSNKEPIVAFCDERGSTVFDKSKIIK